MLLNLVDQTGHPTWFTKINIVNKLTNFILLYFKKILIKRIIYYQIGDNFIVF